MSTADQYEFLSQWQSIKVMLWPFRERMEDLWKCVAKNLSKLDCRIISRWTVG